MNLFSPPSLDDLIRLLKAWRFWSLGALLGGLIGLAVYYVVPPPYRAHAVVLVDFNLEEAWPQETDRQQFYYLERETRKLEEIAYSDAVLDGIVRTTPGITLEELRSGMLLLSQPAEGGWNFYVDDADPSRAASVASAWTTQFTEQVHAQVASADSLNSFIEANATRRGAVPAERSISMSLYIFVGAVLLLMIGSIVVLFFGRPDRLSSVSSHRDTSDSQVL
jgi:capsular polysaccharide biosynthesis protein